MAHVQKLTAGAIGGLSTHCERKTENHKNKLIDPEKTHLNYALDNNKNPLEYFQKRMGEVRVNQRRDDIKVAASWVVTQPRDVAPDESRKFFEAVHHFLSEKYGTKNILWSRVHMDESTPHIHFCFMPVTPDKKHDGKEKLCAKDVLKRSDLQRFHGELSSAMTHVFAREIGIETGKTEKNIPLEKLKVKTALDEYSAELNAIKKDLDTVIKNKLSFVDGRKLGVRLEKEAKQGMFGTDRRISEDLYEKLVKYIWNSGAKDEEISNLGKRLETVTTAAKEAEERAQKVEAQRGHISCDNSELRSKRFEAERKTERLEKIVAAVEKIAPDVLKQATAQVRDHGRGGLVTVGPEQQTGPARLINGF